MAVLHRPTECSAYMCTEYDENVGKVNGVR